MEYTDAPTEIAQITTCPQCGRHIPAEAATCEHCGWQRQGETAEGKASDAFAVVLGVIPGLGHIYKGHRVVGAVILLIVTPIAFVFGVLAAIASAGFGIGLLVFYWIGVMIHAWAIDDRVTPTPDEGEQY